MSPTDRRSTPADAAGDPLAPRRRPTTPLLTVTRPAARASATTRCSRAIDLEVRRGEVVVLIGPSGSGKTTVLRSLNGLETPDGGIDRVRRRTRARLREAAARRPQRFALRDRSAMVFQHHNLFPHLTVHRERDRGAGARAAACRRRRPSPSAEALLERVGLAEKRDAYPFELSGGQQQRVGIVRALALKPDLLLFDEPTSALDPELVGEVLVGHQGARRRGLDDGHRHPRARASRGRSPTRCSSWTAASSSSAARRATSVTEAHARAHAPVPRPDPATAWTERGRSGRSRAAPRHPERPPARRGVALTHGRPHPRSLRSGNAGEAQPRGVPGAHRRDRGRGASSATSSTCSASGSSPPPTSSATSPSSPRCSRW